MLTALEIWSLIIMVVKNGKKTSIILHHAKVFLTNTAASTEYLILTAAGLLCDVLRFLFC